MEILTNIINISFLGNEIWKYFIFILIMYLTLPASKIINFILNNYIKKWAEKTKIKFDDILFNSVNPSITLFTFAGLFYVGSSFLNQGNYDIIFNKILNFLVIIPVVYFLIKFSTEMIGFYLKGEGKIKKVNEAAIDLLMSIVKISLFAIGLLLILSNLGYNVSALLAGLGVGGLAFALAAQDVLKNFFAGIALIFDKTFNKGERVNFNGNSGRIEELKLRSTKLRTYDGTLLTIPNAELANNVVENVTKVPRVKVKMTIGVEYSTSVKKLREAKKIILEAVTKNQYSDENRCDVWFDNFGPYSLDIQVIYYSLNINMDNWKERISMKEDINFAIKESFEKAKISMAFPTQTIEIKK